MYILLIWFVGFVATFAIMAYKQGAKSYNAIDAGKILEDFFSSLVWPIIFAINLVAMLYMAIAWIGKNISYWLS